MIISDIMFADALNVVFGFEMDIELNVCFGFTQFMLHFVHWDLVG